MNPKATYPLLKVPARPWIDGDLTKLDIPPHDFCPISDAFDAIDPNPAKRPEPSFSVNSAAFCPACDVKSLAISAAPVAPLLNIDHPTDKEDIAPERRSGWSPGFPCDLCCWYATLPKPWYLESLRRKYNTTIKHLPSTNCIISARRILETVVCSTSVVWRI